MLVFKADTILGKDKEARRMKTATPGGGTVVYVTPMAHMYVNDEEDRMAGGTPPIVGAIRTGLALQLQSAVGLTALSAADQRTVRMLVKRWQECPNLIMLGGNIPRRLPTFSLCFAAPGASGAGGGRLLLHHDFVVALLNDLFGIQARGGCMCAGPYGELHIARAWLNF
jgi:selenocysteine lyase/cysteine desulfurase